MEVKGFGKGVYLQSVPGAEEKNVEFARKYAKFAYEKGCLPVVPHLYFPQFLKESDVQERMAGIQFGLSLLKECREV